MSHLDPGAEGRTEDRILERLCAELGDPDPEVRRQARLALVMVGEPAVRPLCRALVGSTAASRQGAAEALGLLASGCPSVRSALPALRRLLSPWSGEPPAARRAYRIALQMIEREAGRNANLPIPAAPPRLASTTLPLPAAEADDPPEKPPEPK